LSVSVAIPTLNGGARFAEVLDAVAAQRVERDVELVVADSRSTDGSRELAAARAALVVDGDLGFVPAEIEDRDEFVAGVRRVRVFAGHSGWGPGQLEAEIEEDSWIVEPAERGDVFTADPEALWSKVLRRKGAEYVLLATMPMDPSLN
jgi:putative AlgH/UPF0301 family transcriptional regulator